MWGGTRPVKTGWWRTLARLRPWRDCRTSQRSTWLSAGWVVFIDMLVLASNLYISLHLLSPAGGSPLVVAGAKSRAADEAWGCQFGQRHPDVYIPQSANGGLPPKTHRHARREPQLDNPSSSNGTRPISTIVSTQWPRGPRGSDQWRFSNFEPYAPSGKINWTF